MPVKIPDNLPAIELLKKENIFVMSDLRANEQDIRPMKVLILNLMPLKITTETDFIRLLSNNPLQVEVEFLRLDTHMSKNTPQEHLELFYKSFSAIEDQYYDGMIITGAPVEMMPLKKLTIGMKSPVFSTGQKNTSLQPYIFAGHHKRHSITFMELKKAHWLKSYSACLSIPL